MKSRRNEADFTESKAFLDNLEALSKQGLVSLYYGDESGFSQKSNITYSWSPITQPQVMTAYPKNKRLNVFGILGCDDSLFFRSSMLSIKSDFVIDTIDEFVKQLPKSGEKVLVLDNASIHKSKKVKKRIRGWENQGLTLYFIPPYSPELNKIEILWKHIKYHWLPSKAFETFERLTSHVEMILRTYGTQYKVNFS